MIPQTDWCGLREYKKQQGSILVYSISRDWIGTQMDNTMYTTIFLPAQLNAINHGTRLKDRMPQVTYTGMLEGV
jgi:hypothetical protein